MARLIHSRMRYWMRKRKIKAPHKGRFAPLASWPAQGEYAGLRITPTSLEFWPNGFVFGGCGAEISLPKTETDFESGLALILERHRLFRQARASWDKEVRTDVQPRYPRHHESPEINQLDDIVVAAYDGDYNAIAAADPEKIDIYRTDNWGYGFTALHWALFNSKLDAANLILDKFQINPNWTVYGDGGHIGATLATVLHVAAQPDKYKADLSDPKIEEDHLSLVKRLVKLGANVHHRCLTGNTAYSRALGYRFLKIADYLESQGCGPADFCKPWNESGNLLIAMLCQEDSIDEIQEVVKRGAEIPAYADFIACRERTLSYYSAEEELAENRMKFEEIERIFYEEPRKQAA